MKMKSWTFPASDILEACLLILPPHPGYPRRLLTAKRSAFNKWRRRVNMQLAKQTRHAIQAPQRIYHAIYADFIVNN